MLIVVALAIAAVVAVLRRRPRQRPRGARAPRARRARRDAAVGHGPDLRRQAGAARALRRRADARRAAGGRRARRGRGDRQAAGRDRLGARLAGPQAADADDADRAVGSRWNDVAADGSVRIPFAGTVTRVSYVVTHQTSERRFATPVRSISLGRPGRRGHGEHRGRRSALGAARPADDRRLVPARRRAGRDREPEAERPARPGRPDPADVLGPGARRARLGQAQAHARHARALDAARQPHAAVHAVRLRRGLRRQGRARPASRRRRHRHRRRAHHEDEHGELGQPAGLDAAPAAAARAGRLPAAGLDRLGHARGAHARRAVARRQHRARRLVRLALRRTRRASSRSCGRPAGSTRSRAAP